MGWKAVRDHYRIEHDVQVTSAGICIGSPYIHDIIVISVDSGVIVRRWGEPHSGKLGRYLEEMDADPVKLAELVAAKDVFERSIPVYTYEGGDIIEKQCEALGYPNVTHDGCMQYENTFSPDPDLVLTWAIANAQAAVKWVREALEETDRRRAEQSHRLARREEDLRRLTERDRRPSA